MSIMTYEMEDKVNVMPYNVEDVYSVTQDGMQDMDQVEIDSVTDGIQIYSKHVDFPGGNFIYFVTDGVPYPEQFDVSEEASVAQDGIQDMQYQVEIDSVTDGIPYLEQEASVAEGALPHSEEASVTQDGIQDMQYKVGIDSMTDGIPYLEQEASVTQDGIQDMQYKVGIDNVTGIQYSEEAIFNPIEADGVTSDAKLIEDDYVLDYLREMASDNTVPYIKLDAFVPYSKEEDEILTDIMDYTFVRYNIEDDVVEDSKEEDEILTDVMDVTAIPNRIEEIDNMNVSDEHYSKDLNQCISILRKCKHGEIDDTHYSSFERMLACIAVPFACTIPAIENSHGELSDSLKRYDDLIVNKKGIDL